MIHRNTTNVPNHVLDASLKTLKEVELKVLLVIIRSTIGWQKHSDWLATSMLCSRTGACKKAVLNAVKALVEQDLVRVARKNGKAIYSLGSTLQGNNIPQSKKILPVQREKSSQRVENNLPPTKEKITKREFVDPDKIKSIKKSLIELGVIKPDDWQR